MMNKKAFFFTTIAIALTIVIILSYKPSSYVDEYKKFMSGFSVAW